jgi:hypothetical protein
MEKFTSHIDQQLLPRDLLLIRTPNTPTHTPTTTRHPPKKSSQRRG